MRRQTKQKYRRLGNLQAATTYFDLKQGCDLEKVDQPNLEQDLVIVIWLRALQRVKRIGPGNLTRLYQIWAFSDVFLLVFFGILYFRHMPTVCLESRNKYGSLVESYGQNFLPGENKYPKPP